MSKRYYYDDGDAKHGPVSARELQRLIDEGTLSPETWVRPEDSGTWRKWIDTEFTEEEVKAASGGTFSALFGRMGLAQKLAIALFCLLLLPFVIVGGLIYLIVRVLRKL